MTNDDEPTQPTEGEPMPENDTEGHSLAMYEYGRLIARERAQEAERNARELRMQKQGRDQKRR